MAGATHTAILFVHGIGTHARHENLGALLAALEQVEALGTSGALREFKPGREPSRVGQGDDVAFMGFERFARRAGGPWRFKGRFRAYEVHWSPLNAGGVQALRMLTWIARQFSVPPLVAFSHWRQKYRIRVGRLHRARSSEGDPDVDTRTWAYLAARFKRFQGSRGGPGVASRASFKDFLAGVSDGASDFPGAVAAARRWRRTRLPCETSVRWLFALTPIALAAAGLFAWLLIVALREAWVTGGSRGWPAVDRPFVFVVSAFLSLYGAALVLMFVFLTRDFAGVRFWAGMREDDRYHAKRREILAETVAMIRHVLAHPDCRRLVIVAHSLGTAIAYDALRELGQYNEARARRPEQVVRMFPVTDLVTLGSPIDKIAYFFESSESRTYRAARLRDALRGDLSTEPFHSQGRTRIAWTNFHDWADPVSDALYTPLGLRPEGGAFIGATIENVAVVNSPLFAPVASHAGYLRNPIVAGAIHDILFRGSRGPPPLTPFRLALQVARPLSLVFGLGATASFFAFALAEVLQASGAAIVSLSAWIFCVYGITVAVLLAALGD